MSTGTVLELDMTQPEAAARSGVESFDLVAIGETMVAFVSRGDRRRYLAVTAGAESNVATVMAGLGCRVRWVSRLGDDPLGRLIEDSLAAAGVDVAVVVDSARPTGAMTKHVTPSGTRSQYYRSESAARELAPDDLVRVGRTQWIHVTGITAALSPSAAELVEAIVDRRGAGGGRVSFDFNHRPALWPDAATAAGALLPLARRSDLVFIGDDEAERLFDTTAPEVLAELMLSDGDQQLVLKRGAGPASVVTGRGSMSVPSLSAEVVDPTGAGDAFAAGYLAATIRDWPVAARLRLGHLMASRVIGVLDDTPPPLPASELAALSPASLELLWTETFGGGGSVSI